MSWDQIRGHDAARQQLLAALRRGRLGHAYLFVGPDGVGKRRFATEFAKALLCEAPPAEFAACDHCPACAQVAAVTHPDFAVVRKPDDKLEMPVEVMREACAALGLKPVRGGRKITVVEDADDFNEESANCFLKTLEEPPPGAVLILLATSVERQLPTVQSRCQVVRFHPLSSADLKLVLIDHQITDPAVRDRAARLSGGSPGRALALADEELWQFRQTLLAALAATRPDPVTLAAKMWEHVEAAGKESRDQRERASLVIRLLTDILQTALRVALGAEVPDADATERNQLRAIAAVGADAMADQLEACAEADGYVERRVQLVLLLEQLADRLCRR
jgi:DNA polymerase-3 subunit delta'